MTDTATFLPDEDESIPDAEIVAEPSSLRKEIVRGSFWSVAGFAAATLIRIGSNPILTRLLSPSMFGLASLASLFVNGLQQVSDLGVGPAIISSTRGDEAEFLDTAWTLSIVRGVALWIMACVIAYPIGWIYRAELRPSLLASLIVVIGFNAVVSGFNSTSLSTLNRRLQLGKITALSITSQIIAFAVTMGLALVYRNAWAIVLGGCVSNIFIMVVSHFMIRGHRDRLRWDPRAIHELYHFGKWIFVSTLFTFFANEIDRPLLARFGSLSILGVYYLSLTLARMPIDLISRLTSLTLYPALAKSAQAGIDQLAKSVLRARRLLLAAGVAIVLGMTLGAPLFFNLLYTKTWHDAGWIAQLMAIGCWASILQLSADRALLAIGKSGALAYSNGVNFVTTAVGCIAGQYIGSHYFNHNWGLGGFVLGVGLGNLTGHIVIEIAMAMNGIRIYGQDLLYTAILVGLTVAGLGLPHVVTTVFPSAHAGMWNLLCPAVILLVTCCWASERAWRFLANR